MTYIGWVDEVAEQLPDADAAAAFLDRRAQYYSPAGHRGWSFVFGTPEDEGRGPLWLDIDIDAGRAALRWSPDGSHAVELEPSEAIEVYGPPEDSMVPAELARVSIDTARRAVAEYMRTGQRPTGVDWVAG